MSDPITSAHNELAAAQEEREAVVAALLAWSKEFENGSRERSLLNSMAQYIKSGEHLTGGDK